MVRRDIAGVSPLYERLMLAAADRPEILEIMLAACVWPEHEERRQRLAAAREDVRNENLDRRSGGIEEAGEALREAAERGQAVLVTSVTVLYVSAEERRRLVEMVSGVGSEHDLDWVMLEGPQVVADLTGLGEHPGLELDGEKATGRLALVSYRGGRRTERLLARCEGHAGRIEWLEGSARLSVV